MRDQLHALGRSPADQTPAGTFARDILVLEEFAALHPGNAVRFGIRPLELAAWKERHGGVG